MNESPPNLRSIAASILLSTSPGISGSYICSNPIRRKRGIAAGYTLLELIIALALLGGLMTIAWSLMGTYRRAEQRSWSLSERARIVRTVQSWLSFDGLQLVALMPQNTPGVESPVPDAGLGFTGSSLGFSAGTYTSVSPALFYERLLNAPFIEQDQAGEVELSLEDLYDRPANADSSGKGTLFPPQSVVVEYVLEPFAESYLESTSPRGSDLRYRLIRREWVRSEQIPQSLSNSLTEADPDRVLSLQDLYRIDADRLASKGVLLRESTIDGLLNAEFQYFDGVAWFDSWDADPNAATANDAAIELDNPFLKNQNPRLPRAIGLSFDFPERAAMRPIRRQGPTRAADESNTLSGDSPDDTMAIASQWESVLAQSGAAEMAVEGAGPLSQNSLREVQIIIRTCDFAASRNIPLPNPTAGAW